MTQILGGDITKMGEGTLGGDIMEYYCCRNGGGGGLWAVILSTAEKWGEGSLRGNTAVEMFGPEGLWVVREERSK